MGKVSTAASVNDALRYLINERFANVVIAGSFSRGKTNEKTAKEYAEIYLWNLGLQAPGEAKPHQKPLEAISRRFLTRWIHPDQRPLRHSPP